MTYHKRKTYDAGMGFQLPGFYTKKLALICGVAIVCVVAVLLVWHMRSNGSSASTPEIVIEKVSRHYQVPTDETPTVAQIKDKDSLHKEQEFYQNAQNGDYVLVYSKAKTAFLYRESSDRLIKVSPITSSSGTTTPDK